MSWINVLSTNRNIAIVWRSDATLASSAVATLAQINLNGYVSPEAMNLHFHVSGGHLPFSKRLLGYIVLGFSSTYHQTACESKSSINLGITFKALTKRDLLDVWASADILWW